MEQEQQNETSFKGSTDPMAEADAAASGVDPSPALPSVAVPVQQGPDDPLAKLAAATGIADVDTLKMIVEAATASLTASHKAEMNALREDMQAMQLAAGHEGKVQDLNESMSGYPWQYYRIGPEFADAERRGWITLGPGGAERSGHRDTGSYANYLKKGFIPITKYGTCPVPTSPNAPQSFISMLRRGGAAEFPASQLVAYNWHRINPFAKLGIRFPQITSELLNTLTGFTCEYCGFTREFMPGDVTAGTAYRIHLINADKISFKEAIEAVRAAGLTVTPFSRKTIKDAIKASRPTD